MAQYLTLDSDLLAALVQKRIDARRQTGARRRVATLRPDNPFLEPTPPELLPWRKLVPKRATRPERRTALLAALVWAMLMGFIAVAYALHAPLPDFPTP